jgi:putative sterol carrier protein
MYHSPHAGRRPSAETRENAVGYFKSAEEVDQYLGEMFRVAADHPEVGPKMKAAKITLRIHYSDPDCELNVRFHDPMEVCLGPWSHEPDITMWMKGDIADRFWRGKYNMAVGMAKGEVKSKGPVSQILKMVPLTKPLFPVYLDLVKERDAVS